MFQGVCARLIRNLFEETESPLLYLLWSIGRSHVSLLICAHEALIPSAGAVCHRRSSPADPMTQIRGRDGSGIELIQREKKRGRGLYRYSTQTSIQ